MAKNNTPYIRQEQIEQDSRELQVGDRFGILNPDGSIPKSESSEILYEKGIGLVLGGVAYRIVGLTRFADFQGTRKIGISTYWNNSNGKMHWDCRAEEFPVTNPGLYGLIKTAQLWSYDHFLNEHGIRLEDIK